MPSISHVNHFFIQHQQVKVSKHQNGNQDIPKPRKAVGPSPSALYSIDQPKPPPRTHSQPATPKPYSSLSSFPSVLPSHESHDPVHSKSLTQPSQPKHTSPLGISPIE